MSSISYNSRLLEQFRNIGDSVSQIGAGDTNYPEDLPMDLGQVQVELKLREQKIVQLTADKQKLKTLVKKAKDAIDSLNGKFKAA